MIDPALIRSVAPIAAATALVGASFGAIAVSTGFDPWLAILMSLTVSSGGSQFVAVGVVAAGGAPIAAVVAGLVLNARHLPFGLVVGPWLGKRWSARLLGSQIIFDESVAFALAHRDKGNARAAFWTAGVILYSCWNIGTVVGVVAGEWIGDPNSFGVDAAFPAGILALLLPTLRDWQSRAVAASAAVLALVATPLLPPGGPVLVALGGLAAAALPTPGRKKTDDEKVES